MYRIRNGNPLDYEGEVELTYTDFDVNGELFPQKILELFQDVTSAHSVELKISYLDLIKRNLLWVLVRNRYEAVSPYTDGTVTLRTWVHERGTLRYNRDYAIYQHGKMIFKGEGEYCLIDAKKRRLSKEGVVYPSAPYVKERNFPDGFLKDPEFELNEEEKIGEYVVSFSDLDLNRHANNTTYARWVVDVLPGILGLSVKGMQFHYLSECSFGDKVEFYLKKDGNDLDVFGYDRTSGKLSFECICRTK